MTGVLVARERRETSMKANGYVPAQADLDYIESIAQPIHPVLLEIEAAAREEDVPILGRSSARVLATIASDRLRIVEVGTAFGYSTLWMALAQPHRGTIVTIDPDVSRTERAKAWWRKAGIPDDRIHVVSRPGLEAFADEEEVVLQGPFELAFVDAIKTEYSGYLEAIIPRLSSAACVVADNVLWGGRLAEVDAAARASGRKAQSGGEGPDPAVEALRAFNATILRDRRFSSTILPVGDGLLIAALRT